MVTLYFSLMQQAVDPAILILLSASDPYVRIFAGLHLSCGIHVSDLLQALQPMYRTRDRHV